MYVNISIQIAVSHLSYLSVFFAEQKAAVFKSNKNETTMADYY